MISALTQAERLEKAAHEYLEILKYIEQANHRKDELAEVLRAGIEPGQSFRGVKVVAPPRRFSADKAAQVLTTEQLAMITTSAPSVAGLRNLPPVIADLCYVTTGIPSVRQA